MANNSSKKSSIIKNTECVISIDALTKRYGNVTAVDNLSLQIEKGITYGLLGPNGSGKTTLIRILMGLVRPDSGTASILGHSPKESELRKLLGYMTQLPALYVELSVQENLDFFGQIYGLDKHERRQRIEELLNLVDLHEKTRIPVSSLSGGMKQRLSLACALVHDPEIIFLDEPTVGVDPALRISFWNYFKDLNKKGITIIISSHVMDEASRCDRLGLLSNGKLIADGNLQSILRNVEGKNLEDVFLQLSEKKE